MNGFGTVIHQISCMVEPDDQARLLSHYLSHLSDEDQRAVASLLARPPRERKIKLSAIREMVQARISAELYSISHKYVGDTSETIALLWQPQRASNRTPKISEICDLMASTKPAALPALVQNWLDACDAHGRYIIIKLLTGGIRNLAPATVISQAITDAGLIGIYKPKTSSPESKQLELFVAPPPAAPITGSIDAVLMYVQRARSRSSPLVCTFGVWMNDAMVPVARVKVDALAREIWEYATRNTSKRFGSTTEVSHSPNAALLARISYKAIESSNRHKSKIKLVSPVIEKIHGGSPASMAAHLSDLTLRLPGKPARD